VGECLSIQPVWFERTSKIDALHEKELLLIKGDEPNGTVWLRVETVEPNSPQGGKVCIVAWNIIVSTEVFENVEMKPTKAPKYVETGLYERFLTQAALDSIRPHNGRLLGNVEFELVI
jgi:hypothetical protein